MVLLKRPLQILPELHNKSRGQRTLILTALSVLKTSGNNPEQPQTDEKQYHLLVREHVMLGFLQVCDMLLGFLTGDELRLKIFLNMTHE